MAANQAIEYAPQCGDLTVESFVFYNNNVVGVFSYTQITLAYKEICKFLMNCPLAKAFTKTPSVVYQNFLREFSCTTTAYDLNPPINDSKARLLKEYLIKFSMMNGKKPLILYYKTFVESTRLDYAKGTYVSHPSTEVVKAKLAKIIENSIILDRTSVLKTTFLVTWKILFTFVIQGQRFVSCAIEVLLGSNYTQDECFGSPLTILIIMEYLVNVSKRRAFWSLNKDILKIIVLITNTLYPSRKIRCIRACTHQRAQRKQDQYAVSSEDQYAILVIYVFTQLINMAYPLPLDTAYRSSKIESESKKHFKKLSLDELRSSDFNLFSDQEYSKEEVTETMAETIEQYMSKTQADYGSGVARPKIEDKDKFELKGQFLKELQTNNFNGSDHKDANEHIEKVLEIIDLFHILNISIDQVMLRAFPMSLTGAASR
ncbi:hypothetical protein Tco_0368586 [Tanacetum coccineum]